MGMGLAALPALLLLCFDDSKALGMESEGLLSVGAPGSVRHSAVALATGCGSVQPVGFLCLSAYMLTCAALRSPRTPSACTVSKGRHGNTWYVCCEYIP